MAIQAPSMRFVARRAKDLEAQRRALTALVPGAQALELSPTWARSAALRGSPWLFQVLEDGRPLDAAAGVVLRSGRVRRGLHVVLSAKPARMGVLLAGLGRFMRRRLISQISIESLGIEQSVTPSLAGETVRVRDANFVVDLTATDPVASFSKNHRRNLRRAEQNGVQRTSLPAGEAVREHVRLVQASLDRRAERGERAGSAPSEASFLRLIGSGAAWLCQAGVAGQVLSSDLVARVGDAGFYFSGGTLPEGMKIGSSHFLMHSILAELGAQGCRTLCLGYPSLPELARFKEGFGARPVPVERVEAAWPHPAERTVLQLAGWLRRAPAAGPLRPATAALPR